VYISITGEYAILIIDININSLRRLDPEPAIG
jgi:hypothetical protein